MYMSDEEDGSPTMMLREFHARRIVHILMLRAQALDRVSQHWEGKEGDEPGLEGADQGVWKHILPSQNLRGDHSVLTE